MLGEVRTCFNQLKTLAERLHRDLGINPSMRAVMEALARRGRQTVPDIATSKGVSRQHIQMIMNALQAGGLVDSIDNPAHRRSPLFDLTERGRAIFSMIGTREKEPLLRMASKISPDALEQARETLSQINRYLREEIQKGTCDEDEL